MAKVIKDDNFDNHLLEQQEKKLVKLGYKFTGQRKIIFETLLSEHRLFDAESVFIKAKEIDPSVGIATVYRTLELLSRLKLICKIDIGTEKSMYMLDVDCNKETSVYMVCTNCKKVITNNDCLKSAVKIRLREDAEKNILENCRLKIDNFQIVFKGLCDDCN
jgi:Fur family ferric uptake transcriptional regulator